MRFLFPWISGYNLSKLVAPISSFSMKMNPNFGLGSNHLYLFCPTC